MLKSFSANFPASMPNAGNAVKRRVVIEAAVRSFGLEELK
jgi:hypothetical protein